MIAFRLRVGLALFCVCLVAPIALQAQSATATPGAVQGTVLFGGPEHPLCASGAKVALYGDIGVIETVADQDGKFSFSGLAPGIYFIEATYFGLHEGQNIEVDGGIVTQISLDLTPPGPNGHEEF